MPNKDRRIESQADSEHFFTSFRLCLCCTAVLLVFAASAGCLYPKQRVLLNDSNPVAALSSRYDDVLSQFYDSGNQLYNPIRQWGCNLSDTPLVFVHIGKGGGGEVRVRFAASALNYTRGGRKNAVFRVTDGSFYQVDSNKDPLLPSNRAYFCNSGHPSRRPTPDDNKTFEGYQLCRATTPIGRAVACPEATNSNLDYTALVSKNAELQAAGRKPKKLGICKVGGCDIDSEYCHQVYVGHNALGSEFHWLPPKFLHRHWESIMAIDNGRLQNGLQHSENANFIDRAFRSIYPQRLQNGLQHSENAKFIDRAFRSIYPQSEKPRESWCPQTGSRPSTWRPYTFKEYHELYEQCSVPLASLMDQKVIQVLGNRLPKYSSSNLRVDYLNWAPVYASLPALRVTVVREPFSWFLSKYFWHYKERYAGTKCDDEEFGWMARLAVDFILKVCGEDCYARLELMGEDVESLAFQAEQNLRQSFAVVGLVDNIDQFYDMVTARVSYIDMSRNPELKGGVHSTQKNEDYVRCKTIFSSEEFQQKVLKNHAEVALLKHLHTVAIEVNQFQLKELEMCRR